MELRQVLLILGALVSPWVLLLPGTRPLNQSMDIVFYGHRPLGTVNQAVVNTQRAFWSLLFHYWLFQLCLWEETVLFFFPGSLYFPLELTPLLDAALGISDQCSMQAVFNRVESCLLRALPGLWRAETIILGVGVLKLYN